MRIEKQINLVVYIFSIILSNCLYSSQITKIKYEYEDHHSNFIPFNDFSMCKAKINNIEEDNDSFNEINSLTAKAYYLEQTGFPLNQTHFINFSYQVGVGYEEEDKFSNKILQMSWEAKPGAETKVLPGIFDSSLSLQLEYLEKILDEVFHEDISVFIKNDLALDMNHILGTGSWNEVTGWGMQSLMLTDIISLNSSNSSIRKKLGLVADLLGSVLSQEAVAWHFPKFTKSFGIQNGIEVNLGRNMRVEEAQELYLAIAKELNHYYSPPIYSVNGFRVLNFHEEKFILEGMKDSQTLKNAEKKNKKFIQSIIKAISSVPSILANAVDKDGNFKFDTFESFGELRENNWASQCNRDYLERIKEASISLGLDSLKILSWIEDLTRQVFDVNLYFTKSYNWGNPCWAC